MSLFAVEMPSVLLMAAVRNVPIVCLLCQLNSTVLLSHVSEYFCFLVLSRCIISQTLDPERIWWILTIWLLLQARPTLYQVVKEMVDKMGYEV